MTLNLILADSAGTIRDRFGHVLVPGHPLWSDEHRHPWLARSAEPGDPGSAQMLS